VPQDSTTQFDSPLAQDMRFARYVGTTEVHRLSKRARLPTGLNELVAILRGRPIQRGDEVSSADVHFREDASLLRQHMQSSIARLPSLLHLGTLPSRTLYLRCDAFFQNAFEQMLSLSETLIRKSFAFNINRFEGEVPLKHLLLFCRSSKHVDRFY